VVPDRDATVDGPLQSAPVPAPAEALPVVDVAGVAGGVSVALRLRLRSASGRQFRIDPMSNG